MFQKFLVPVDFSDSSTGALRYASMLANASDGSLDLAHALDFPMFVPPATLVVISGVEATLTKQVYAQAKKRLEELVDTCGVGNRVATSDIQHGSAASVVLDLAVACDSDLVVMGTRGRTGLSRWVLGSVAANVLRRCSCPVLTIPERSIQKSVGAEKDPAQLPTRVLLPVDKAPAVNAALDCLAKLPNAQQLKIALVSVVEPLPFVPPEATAPARIGLAGYAKLAEGRAEESLSRCADYARALGFEVTTTEIRKGDVVDTILEAAHSSEADWIAMATHQRTMVGHWLLGSVTEKVVGRADVPVFTVPMPSED